MSGFSLKTLSRWLPPRAKESHKGAFGHVLIVAGSRGMTGAAVLAARGALRSGCGLVTVAVPQSQQPVVAAQLAEAMTAALPEAPAGVLRAEAAGALQELHRRSGFTVLAIGPGLTTYTDAARAVVGILGSLPIPAVVDADALNCLAREPEEAVATLLKSRPAHVFTPHPGELARFLKITAAAVQQDRPAAARRLASELGGVCLLKGRGTLITDGARLWRNPTGNSGLAKGGSGDALTGIIAGLWAQRLSAAKSGSDSGFEAAALGAYLHGLAADIAAREKTEYALLASDVIEALPAAFRKLA
jgi:hydroxyethylthiazole kinase-like uncharacterized protein yjeF